MTVHVSPYPLGFGPRQWDRVFISKDITLLTFPSSRVASTRTTAIVRYFSFQAIASSSRFSRSLGAWIGLRSPSLSPGLVRYEGGWPCIGLSLSRLKINLRTGTLSLIESQSIAVHQTIQGFRGVVTAAVCAVRTITPNIIETGIWSKSAPQTPVGSFNTLRSVTGAVPPKPQQ